MNVTEVLKLGPYSWLPQPELLETLAKQNICITSQTLRNWERNHLIVPPKRSGQRGGRSSQYCKFVLAEAFAVYTLTQGELSLTTSDSVVTLPKFSLANLALARKQLLEANCRVSGYPAPPSDNDTGIHYNLTSNIFNNGLPNLDFKVSNDGNLKVNAVNNHMISGVVEHLQYHFFQTLYLSWFYTLSKGCEVFLREYKKE